MALIVCKTCGKKVSDTVDRCIHCGAPIAEEPFVLKTEEKKETVKKSEQTLHNYSSYDSADQIKLEKEFLSQDKWARRFRRTKNDISKFKHWFIHMCWLFIIYRLVYLYLYKEVFEQSIYRKDMTDVSIYLMVALFAVSFIGMLVTWGMEIAKKRSVKRYIYLKKYQRWLKETKQIQYNPQFFEKKEQAAFDQIDIEKINF